MNAEGMEAAAARADVPLQQEEDAPDMMFGGAGRGEHVDGQRDEFDSATSDTALVDNGGSAATLTALPCLRAASLNAAAMAHNPPCSTAHAQPMGLRTIGAR